MLKHNIILVTLLLLCQTVSLQAGDAAQIFERRQLFIDKIISAKIEYQVINEADDGSKETEKFIFLKNRDFYKIYSYSQQGRAEWIIEPSRATGIGFDSKNKPDSGQIEPLSFPQSSRFLWAGMYYGHETLDGKRLVNLADIFREEDMKSAIVDELENEIIRVKVSHRTDLHFEFRFEKANQYRLTELKVDIPALRSKQTVSFRKYRNIKGIPIPFEIETITKQTGFNHPVQKLVLTSVALNEPAIESQVTLPFPENLTVHDNIEKITYEVGPNGQRKKIRPIELMHVLPEQSTEQKAKVNPSPVDLVEKPAYATFGWVLPASIALLIGVLVFVIWKKVKS
jgi:hypothetical protein